MNGGDIEENNDELFLESIFSYRPDKLQLEQDERNVLCHIYGDFPTLSANVEAKDKKKVLLEFFADQMYIYDIMDTYSLTIKDIVEIIAKYHTEIFKSSTYINKVKCIIDTNGY